MKISVLINTLNEEKNIRNCLESVKWADEIIIVDMYSEDRTVEIAKDYTDKIYMYERVGYVEPARQFGLINAKNDWILVVDADEIVTVELRNKLIEIINSELYDAVLIPHKNYFFGYPMKGTAWGPLQDMHIRCFKKDMMNFSDRIHSPGSLHSSAKIYRLMEESCAFVHFNYLDVEHFLEKLNRYTSIEARNAYERGERFTVSKMVYRIIKELGVRFILRKGYKDGFQGFALSFLMACYRLSSDLKLHVKSKYLNREKIEEEYRKIAEREIRKYG